MAPEDEKQLIEILTHKRFEPLFNYFRRNRVVRRNLYFRRNRVNLELDNGVSHERDYIVFEAIVLFLSVGLYRYYKPIP